MPAPRRTIRRLACAGLFGACALLAPGLLPRAGTVSAAPPINLFAAASIDGQGIVLTWNLTVLTLNAPAFLLTRRAAMLPGDPGVLIATAGNADRGFTDYTLPSAGVYRYTLTAVQPGPFRDASPEACTGFTPGVPGTARPVFGTGCSRFYQTLPAGASAGAIAAHFDPFSAVISLWRYDATAGRFTAGFFARSNTPLDFATVPIAPEFDYICLSQPATYR
jgi:hypothetical protein